MDCILSGSTSQQHAQRPATICGTFSDRIVARPEQIEQLKQRALLLTRNARIRDAERRHGDNALPPIP